MSNAGCCVQCESTGGCAWPDCDCHHVAEHPDGPPAARVARTRRPSAPQAATTDAERAMALARKTSCDNLDPWNDCGFPREPHSEMCDRLTASILAAFGEVVARRDKWWREQVDESVAVQAARAEGSAAGLAFAKHVVKEGYEPDECEECANVKASINSEGGKP